MCSMPGLTFSSMVSRSIKSLILSSTWSVVLQNAGSADQSAGLHACCTAAWVAAWSAGAEDLDTNAATTFDTVLSLMATNTG